jgi:putative mRNA 3-end processing factor
MPTMRAAGMARCGRRPRRWRSWTRATARRTARPVAYGETRRVGEVDVGFVPAGHVLGSAQIVLEHRGRAGRRVGRLQAPRGPDLRAVRAVPCDIFITEATFGLPVFRHPDTGSEIDRLLHRLHAEPERCVLVGAYALGKAQRVITELRGAGHDEPIYYPRRDGAAVPALESSWACRSASFGRRPARPRRAGRPYRHLPARRAQRPLVAAAARPGDAMASGWMRIRQRARQRNVELPLIISDHADWDELTQTIREVAPKEVWITHGREEALMHWCMTHQIKAGAAEPGRL